MDENNKPYLIVIFGKDGCPHCTRLKEEVRELLEEADYKEKFSLDYQDLSTAEGMTAYAGAQTVNGQRIPALQLMRYDSEQKAYLKIPDRRKESFDARKGRLFVPVYLQLETDYSSGKEEIGRQEIRDLLALAETG